MSAARSGSVAAWVRACRPATLGAAFVPVAVGSACVVNARGFIAGAAGGFRLGPALAALAGAMLIQIGANLANDVFDHEKGVDTEERLGPTRAVQSGQLTARAVRAGMAIAFALAFVIGAYLSAVAGWPVVVIGVSSVLAGIAYTGGPFPLGYHGLGDLFVMIFFGFVAVCGTAFVEAGRVPAVAVWASLSVGALPTALLVVNNLRDRETDARAGKHTLAVRLGAKATIAEYLLLLALAYAVPIGIALAGQHRFGLITLATAPIAIGLGRRIFSTVGRALNEILAATARLMVLHGLLLAAGIALG